MKATLFLIFLAFVIPSFSQEIDAILDAAGANENGPGFTVGVVKDGQLIYQGHRGLMNLEHQIPFNDSTVFGLASVTKQFTSACIAILEKEGKLSIEDDVRKYIPELNVYEQPIKIKHLLNHTSGIRNYNVLLDLKGFDYAHQGYNSEMIHDLMFRQKGVNNLPGDKMLYSNTNYVLLVLIVERIAGLKIHDFARQKLFDPLDMPNTNFRSDIEEVIPNSTSAYYKKGGVYREPKSLTLCVGAGGMVSSINDLAKWSQIFLDPDHEFAFIADFVTKLEPLNDGTPMKHARGMFVSPYGDYITWNHSGRGVAMRAQFICIPDLDVGVCVYANAPEFDVVGLSYQILDLWMKDKPRDPESAEIANYIHTSDALSAFQGNFQELNSDLQMKIEVINDTLTALSSFGRIPNRLESVDAHVFARSDNGAVTYTFVDDPKSEVDLMVDFGGAIFYFERIELVAAPSNLEDFVGGYYSKELDTSYEIRLIDDQLILDYANNRGLVLKEYEKDVFGANRRTKYSFTRDVSGEIMHFTVASEGTVKDILFQKIN